MDPSFDPLTIADPTTRRMVEVATTEFDGASADGTARAVVRGNLTVKSVEVEPTTSAPCVVGQRLAEAVNAALGAALSGTRAAFLAIPGLDPGLRDVLAGEAELSTDDMVGEVDPATLNRDFSGAQGDVLVTVNGRSQRVATIVVRDLSDESLGNIPTATNRALAAAQLGQDGATPLEDRVDEALEQLDEKMSAIEARLDGVDDVLDTLARDLGL